MDCITFVANFFKNIYASVRTRVGEFLLPLLQPQLHEVQRPLVALDRPIQVMGFCFAALSIPMMKIQNLNHIPMAFHFACLMLILSFVALSLSVLCISRNYEALRIWLENAGVFFATTTFFIAMSVFSPLSFKLVYWIIYALLLLGFSIFHR